MAINYLNTVNLNKNSLDNARIQNLAVEPTADTPGQIYFNTVSQTLRITEEILPATDPKTYKWVSVSGDITGLVAGTDIDITNETGPTPTINHADITRSDSADTGAPSYGGTFAAVDNITTSDTGHVTAVNVKTFTLPTIAYDLGKAAASANLVLSKDGTAQDTISFAGTASQIEINVATEDSYTFKFPDAGVVLPNGSTATTQATGDNSTKVATTAFVQSAVTGLLEFKGGFDADTGTIVGGTTNLTKNDQPNAGDQRVAVAVGDYYVVTADGDFFGNTATPLTVGDSVIVKTAAAAGASTESDFIIVQSDTDLATATTVGLGNVAVSTDSNLEGIDVSYASPTTGTASVGLDIQGLTGDDGTGDPISNFEIPFYNAPDDQNKKITIAQLVALASSNNTATGTISAGNLTGTVTHAFGVNTIVQTIDSSGNTVICDVSRTATTSVATISTVQATDITILVQKIG